MIDGSEIAGTHPAIFSECVFGRFFVFEIAFHHVFSLDLDFSYLIIGIFRIDAYLHDAFEYLSGRTGNELIVVIIADQRAAFGHAVADGKGELDFIEKFCDLFVHGCSSDDDFTEASA